MTRLRMAYGADAYGFHPEGFCLPSEMHRFRAACASESVPVAPSDPSWAVRDGLWVCKPSDLSRGRKICVVRGPGDVSIDQGSIVQRYLARPLCTNGYKFDLRLYVVVTSVRPLRVFLYHDGLVRFATKPYAAKPAAAAASDSAAPASLGVGSVEATGATERTWGGGPQRSTWSPRVSSALLRATAIPERWRSAALPAPAASLRGRVSSDPTPGYDRRRLVELRAAAGAAAVASSLASSGNPDFASASAPTAGLSNNPASTDHAGLALHGPPHGPAERWCASLSDVHAHLTNTSLNKESATFGEHKNGIGPGCKWRLRDFRRRLARDRAARRSTPWAQGRHAAAATLGQLPGPRKLVLPALPSTFALGPSLDSSAVGPDDTDGDDSTPRIAPLGSGSLPRLPLSAALKADARLLAGQWHPDAAAPEAASGGPTASADDPHESTDPLAGCWDAVRSLVCLTCLALPQSATAAGSARQPSMSPHARRAGRPRREPASSRRPATSSRGDLACFELLGLDVMLDERGRPWLLEVNASPALSVEGLADEGLKPALVQDTVQLVSAEAQRFARLQSASSPAKQAAAGRHDLRPARPLQMPAAERDSAADTERSAGEAESGRDTARVLLSPRPAACGDRKPACCRSRVSGTACGPFDPLTSPYSARTRYPSSFELVFPFDKRTEDLSHQLASSLDRTGLTCADVAQSWLHADAPAMAAAAERESARQRVAAMPRSTSPAAGDAAKQSRGSAGGAAPDERAGPAGLDSLDEGPPVPPPRGRLQIEPPTLRAQPTLSQLKAARQGAASRAGLRRPAAGGGARVAVGGAAGSASFDPKDASPADAARRAMRSLVRATVERYGSWADGDVALSP